MKLSKAYAKAVEEAMANDRSVQAELTLQQFVAYWLEHDAQPAIENSRFLHPDWSDEQLELNVRFDWISDGLYGWYMRGVARRLATGDLTTGSGFHSTL